jgi:hypothetical protein
VIQKLPQVTWKTASQALAVCSVSMPREDGGALSSKHEGVIKFIQECLYQILYVMVSLNEIETCPKSYRALQKLWPKDCEEFNHQCFYSGLGDAIRVLVRIGRVSSVSELCLWPDYYGEVNKTRRNNWISSLELLMDCEQKVYRSEDNDGNIDPLPNSLWTTCLDAFFEEGGFDMLASHFKPESMRDLAENKEVEREIIFHCKIAQLIKMLVTRKHVIIGQPNMPSSEAVSSAMAAVEMFIASALEWLHAHLTKPSIEPKARDIKLVECLTELIGSENCLALARAALLSKTNNFTSQRGGMRLTQGLKKEHCVCLAHEYLETIQTRLNGSGDEIVKQLGDMQMEQKEDFCYLFKEVIKLMDTEEDKSKVCMVWGDIGLRCLCTSDHRAKAIGSSLLQSLMKSQPSFQAQPLAAATQQALSWLLEVCGQSEDTKTKDSRIYPPQNFHVHFFEHCGDLKCCFVNIYEMLIFTGCDDEAETIDEIWLNTAIDAMRCLGYLSIRKIGLQLIDLSHMEPPHRLIQSLHTLMLSQNYIKTVLDSLFAEPYADPEFIPLASHWFVNTYYREYCYEDDIDLMKYLVDAALHPEWGVAEQVTDLIVKITVTNISIRSLNSLCSLFKESINNEITAAASKTLIMTWIEKTKQKKWVVAVQERLLNLLWTIHMNHVVEDSDPTILEFFKVQLQNIHRFVSSDWNGTECDLTERYSLTARYCITTCATESFAEIRRCIDYVQQQQQKQSFSLSSSSEALTSDSQPELRFRASQAAGLLVVIFEEVDTTIPDILRELFTDDSPIETMELLLDETLFNASCEDVSTTAVYTQLNLFSLLSSYMKDFVPLTFKTVQRIWIHFFGDKEVGSRPCIHRQASLLWFSKILSPKESALFFLDVNTEAVLSRSFVLEQLKCHSSMKNIEDDKVQNFYLSLVKWVNQDVELSSQKFSSDSMSSDL